MSSGDRLITTLLAEQLTALAGYAAWRASTSCMPASPGTAEVAGLPRIAGLCAMLPCLRLNALLGSSRQLSVGPESTTALLTASIVAPLAAGHPQRYAGIAAGFSLLERRGAVRAGRSSLGRLR